jgi:spermidine synthase
VSRRIEEIDWQPTPWGEVSLRRRHDPVLASEVHEVLLGDEFLMSSAFTVAEEQLAAIALSLLPDVALEVVVGGLGLGYTACAVLDDARVSRLHVVDALPPVVDWHQRRLLPLSDRLVADSRCRLVTGDFFAGLDDPRVWGDGLADRLHGVVVDIDHSPRHLLHPAHARLYERAGLHQVRSRLHDGGVFALWSDDPPDDPFLADLAAVFTDVEAHVVGFENPYTGGRSTNTVYTATR